MVIRKSILTGLFLIAGLVAMDMLVATKSAVVIYHDPAPDAYFYETGSDTADYPLDEVPVSSQVACLASDNPLLKAPVPRSAELTPEQIEDMVYTILDMDRDVTTGQPKIQRLIERKRAEKGDSCWVVLKVNLVYAPGEKHALSDQTDPRVFRAVLRYLAEKTQATRISFLACGSYLDGGETGIFTGSRFGSANFRWNSFFAGLPDTFSLAGMVGEIQAANPGKKLDMINLNYNELYSNGLAYNEMTAEERKKTSLAYIPVPIYNGIGALFTSNTEQDNGCYNPTKAIYKSDILVNVPKSKTTGGVGINCTFKNYIGSVSRGVYSPIGDRGQWLGNLDHDNLYKTCLNLFSYHPSDYVLVDALHAMEGEGSHPYSNYTGYLQRNFLAAGSDPVAVESVCAQSMGFHPGDLEMLRYARAKNWGYYEPNRIKVIGDKLSSLTMDFRKAIGEGQDGGTGYYNYGRGCARWLICGPFAGTDLTVNPEGLDLSALDPAAGDSAGGKTWNAYISPGTVVDLAQDLPRPFENSTVYAFTRIYSQAAVDGKIWAGATEGIRVWVNGELAVDKMQNLGYDRKKIEADLRLAKGDNRILVCLSHTAGDFCFSLACVDDGSSSARTGFVPYVWKDGGWNALGTPLSFSSEDKKKYFGGGTLSGTFYHLGKKPAAGAGEVKKQCDLDSNGRVDIVDVIYLLLAIRREPDNKAWDWNADGVNDLADARALIEDIIQGRCILSQAVLSSPGQP